MKALIVGAGIGGLSAAIGLRQAGIEVEVFDKASELREAGAGLLLGANGIKALDHLGVGGAVRRAGAKTLAAELRSQDGARLAGFSAPEVRARAGADSYAIHRTDLQSVLLDAAGRESVTLGAECERFAQDAGGVRLNLSGGREKRGDFLLGADGVHSVVKERLFGPSKLRYAGYTAWRGVAEVDPDAAPAGANFETWGCGTRFGYADLGRGRAYWFATRNAPEGGFKDSDGGREALLRFFRGWHEPIEEVIRTTREEAILHGDVYDRAPLSRWGDGRVTLLGDAAHPMTPNLGQGACQAIEDAATLARCFHETHELEKALGLYEARRTRRTAYIARLSRLMGRVGQAENPVLCRVRDAAVRATPDTLKLRQLEAVLGYDTQGSTATSKTKGVG